MLPEQVIDDLDHSPVEAIDQEGVVANANPLIADGRAGKAKVPPIGYPIIRGPPGLRQGLAISPIVIVEAVGCAIGPAAIAMWTVVGPTAAAPIAISVIVVSPLPVTIVTPLPVAVLASRIVTPRAVVVVMPIAPTISAVAAGVSARMAITIPISTTTLSWPRLRWQRLRRRLRHHLRLSGRRDIDAAVTVATAIFALRHVFTIIMATTILR